MRITLTIEGYYGCDGTFHEVQDVINRSFCWIIPTSVTWTPIRVVS